MFTSEASSLLPPPPQPVVYDFPGDLNEAEHGEGLPVPSVAAPGGVCHEHRHWRKSASQAPHLHTSDKRIMAQ